MEEDIPHQIKRVVCVNMSIEWNDLIQISPDWHENTLKCHFNEDSNKLTIRAFTLKFSGTINDLTPLADSLSQIIHKYVFGKDYIDKTGDIKAFSAAQKVFGKINPVIDGKYGELLLFALVEGILRCPMIASKIPSSFRDQNKGGDGIFLGRYKLSNGKEIDATLIGESKIWEEFSSALKDSLESINRFNYCKSKSNFILQELIVAKKNLFDNIVEVESLYNCLTVGTPEYNKRTLVHPVLIMYDTSAINNIEKKASDNDDAESKITDYIKERHVKHVELINSKLKDYEDLEKVYLDFFIIPVKSVEQFKNAMYYCIHGVQWEK
ncbi:DUF1837 domain-containing protein [Geomonas terrae]|uniref:DUF1837 domain-containing protein n=1 Tax=Geomonas terrae TaxID=2562681 RepID=A0A4S1CF01_9BACT|nr:Hachiman antiphage defense system protein HamA [Geomonas terrae]TGU71630.1 DUF1837 domain-containing protein [Geomonas terrae]